MTRAPILQYELKRGRGVMTESLRKRNVPTALPYRTIGRWISIIPRTILLPVLLLGLVGCSTMRPEPQSHRAVQTTRTDLFDIRQARKTLIGKTPQLVVAAVGRPDHQAGGGNWEWWTYEGEFHDLVTQRTVHEVTLVFRNGKLLDITY